jgi:hypothetical protein
MELLYDIITQYARRHQVSAFITEEKGRTIEDTEKVFMRFAPQPTDLREAPKSLLSP